MALAGLLDSIVDFFFPPICFICGKVLQDNKNLLICKSCIEQLPFIKEPFCSMCGMPFFGDTMSHICGRCQKEPFHFDRARSIFVFEREIKKAIYCLKYNSRPLISSTLGILFTQYAQNLISKDDYDVVVPVPLHKSRLRQRGFNQSIFLAKRLAKSLNIEVDLLRLKRIKDTKPQTQLSERERKINVKGAFLCIDKEYFNNKRVLLVDDVFTTGATVNECARILKSSGAKTVDVLTLARVR